MILPPFSVEELWKILYYDEASGKFTRLYSSKKRWIGTIAGSPNKDGYIQIYVCGKLYRAGQLAWFYKTGIWPDREVDHKNRIRDDDSWNNLRLANNSEQAENMGLRKDNKLGVMGVHEYRPGKFVALYKRQYLGIFDTIDEASNAYISAKRKSAGEFSPV
jgi:hypothetical protein